MYNYTINQKTYHLTQDELTDRLTHLAHITKSTHWIGRDLRVHSSSFVGRFLWIIAQYFVCLRQIFYDVDLEESKSILQQLKPQLQHDNVKKLFHQAVSNFNIIAPRHQVQLLQVQLLKEPEEQVDLQPKPALAKPDLALQEHLRPILQQELFKRPVKVKIQVAKEGPRDAKFFDATSNREVGYIMGDFCHSQTLGPCFLISCMGLKDPKDIGKGYEAPAFRQYMDYLQTGKDPNEKRYETPACMQAELQSLQAKYKLLTGGDALEAVTHYTLVTRHSQPKYVKLFTSVGFEVVEPKDYFQWSYHIKPLRDPDVIIMMKKREKEKPPES